MSGLSQPQDWALGCDVKYSLRLHWCWGGVHRQGSRDSCEETSTLLILGPLKTVLFAYLQGGGALACGDNCVCVRNWQVINCNVYLFFQLKN